MPAIEAIEAERRIKERRLLWKIDLIFMPLLTITYGLQYFDKAVLSSASLFGIIEDLDLSTTTNGVVSTFRYSTATAAFYYGYIISVLPIALLLARVPLVRTLSVFVFMWGVVCLLTIVCNNYPGLVVQRVALGMVEAAVSPGFVALTSLWYKKEEQTTRLGIWYGATGIFSMFSGIINWAIGHANGPLPVWKYMYIFAGTITIAWSAIIYLAVPHSPSKPGKRFSEEERTMLIARAASNHTGKDERGLKWGQMKEAVLDWRIWLFMLMGAAIYVCNGGVTAFGVRIVRSFGYSPLRSIIIVIPGGAFTVVSLWIFGFLAGRYPDSRTILIPVSCLFPIIGALIIWQGSWAHRGLPLFGYYLLPTFGTPYVLLLSVSSANIAGATKKAIATGAIFIGYNVGNIVGSYLVFAEEKAVHYRSTWIAVIVCMVFTGAASLVLRLLMAKENARRDRENEPEGVDAEQEQRPEKNDPADLDDEDQVSIAFPDLTDKEQKSFRYSL